MSRTPSRAGLVFACLAAFLTLARWGVGADAPAEVQWIWFDEGDPLQGAPAETRYFRRAFTLDRPGADEATLEITADNAYTVWVNGARVGSGSDWSSVDRYNVKKHLVRGKNVVAVEARNEGGPAGLLVRLGYAPAGMAKRSLVSDGQWKASKTAPAGWQKADFDDGKWPAAKALGAYGKAGPWRDLAWGGRKVGAPRFTVPAGFRVEQAVAVPESDPRFSLVNMTFDAKGRLLVSREGGPVLLCTGADKAGVLQTVRPYCEQVRNCQGMCWVKDALLLVGDGPQGTGLYRCRDTRGADKIDDVRLLLRFDGGMGEHGPHAVLHGPDGYLYVVVGNHAHGRAPKLAANSPLTRWPTGQMGPDQGKPGSTEDVLLPRQNDANGHAAGLRAPGGTIWRMDHQGGELSLVAAGFRNHFDAAFSPSGELFTFDSDMEWDEGLPWYRAVRVCHCTPGADFVWRTGSANTPDYYLDSLPPTYETGRGSPVGLTFYDHGAFPAKYRGAFFMADWSLGIIYAAHLKRDGASYQATVEKFCTGSPLNVTDLEVGPDAALYFTMGGRGTQGGVYRIVYDTDKVFVREVNSKKKVVYNSDWQRLAAWSRAERVRSHEGAFVDDGKGGMLAVSAKAGGFSPEVVRLFTAGLKDSKHPANERIALLNDMQEYKPLPGPALLSELAGDKDADMRAHAVWLLGVNAYKEGRDALLKALKDDDALVRRRACEALVRLGIEPPVAAVWTLLGDRDRFVRTAARLVLQRIDPKKWAERLGKEEDDLKAYEAIIALCKVDKAGPYNGPIFARLRSARPDGAEALLHWLRTIQMALLHAGAPVADVQAIAGRCDGLFPHKDWRVNRELAILLTHFQTKGLLAHPAQPKLLAALKASAGDRPQQIHYFYCLRLLKDGWTRQQKDDLLAWYDATRSWSGGHSFTPFLENILRDANGIFSADDVARAVAQGEKMPLAAAVLLRTVGETQLPSLPALTELYGRLGKGPADTHRKALRATVVATLGRLSTPAAQAALRKIADAEPAQRDPVARGLARFPTADNFPYLVRGLDSTDRVVLFDMIEALRKAPTKPKADDPAPYRALLLASGRLDPRQRWKAVELLRHWSGGKQFGAEAGEWKPELASWSKWFAQSFPKEPPLPDVVGERPAESKYKFDELRAFLESGAGRKGDAARGRAVFEKASCLKCHKYGKDGEGVGPDLTTLSKRFQRADVLESIVYPSKVISDQYRSTLIVTKKGQQLNGLAAAQGDTVTVLQSDGSKATLKKKEIEQQFASLVSVMPERLLDALTKEEIADLFAFLESEPAK
ncbi:MAG TPA: HEAT repeat domain-containing protein [Gemmataceae bacterium]|nr:HEAT repeat domain-containing protein [Gemmataceae bacterium]